MKAILALLAAVVMSVTPVVQALPVPVKELSLGHGSTVIARTAADQEVASQKREAFTYIIPTLPYLPPPHVHLGKRSELSDAIVKRATSVPVVPPYLAPPTVQPPVLPPIEDPVKGEVEEPIESETQPIEAGEDQTSEDLTTRSDKRSIGLEASATVEERSTDATQDSTLVKRSVTAQEVNSKEAAEKRFFMTPITPLSPDPYPFHFDMNPPAAVEPVVPEEEPIVPEEDYGCDCGAKQA